MSNGAKKTLARSANITQIEGIPPERAVILEFENVEAAKIAYNSEDYQLALRKLDGGADRFLFVIEGTQGIKIKYARIMVLNTLQ